MSVEGKCENCLGETEEGHELCPDCEEEDEFENEGDYYDREWDDDDRSMFQDPGGNSALRAATPDNPRNLPCPTCKQPDRLTPKDVALRYQCNQCADRDERGW